MRELSTVLATREVNVEELHTEVISAPMSGEPLFSLNASLRAPESLSIAALEVVLRQLAQDLVVDVSLAEESPAKGAT